MKASRSPPALVVLMLVCRTAGAGEEMPSIGVQVAADADTGKALVKVVVEKSPAEKAGVMEGDLILKVGKVEVTGHQQCVEEILKSKVGDKLSLTVRRDGADREIVVTVGKRSEVFPPK